MYNYYNSERKERFIEERYNTAILPYKSLENAFSKIEFYEKMVKKDACDFSTTEILDMYKILNFISINSLNVFNNHLSVYTQWCIQQNLVVDCQNHYSELTPAILRNQINRVFADKRLVSYDTLMEWKNIIPNPMDTFLIFALYEGISGKDYTEITYLKLSDFDGNRVTLCTGRTIEVSPVLVQLAKEAAEQETYIALKGDGKPLPLAEADTIFRSFRNADEAGDDFRKGRRVYTRITNILKYVGAESSVTANSIIDSGKLEFIARESEKHGLTRYAYVKSSHLDDYKNQFGCSFVYSRFVNKFKEFFEENME